MYTSHTLSSASILCASIRQNVSLVFIAEKAQKSFLSSLRRYGYIFATLLAFFGFEQHSTYAATETRDFVVTAYYSPLPGQSFYLKGNYKAEVIMNGEGTHGASGRPVFVGMLAAPKSYPFGTRIHFEGLGAGIVEDRGGAIVKAGERGQSYDRIDIWMGTGESGLRRAMIWGKRKVRGTITTDTSLPILKLSDIDSGKVNLGQYASVKAQASGLGLSSAILNMFSDLGYPKAEGETERQMIVEFQLDHGIIQSTSDQGAGVYGPRTRATLESEHAKFVRLRDSELKRIETEKSELLSARDSWEAKYTIATKSVAMMGTPRKGEKGTHVVALQSALKTTGYTKIKPTGVMNTSTIAALKTFQKKNNLNQSGSLDDATREALISALAEKA